METKATPIINSFVVTSLIENISIKLSQVINSIHMFTIYIHEHYSIQVIWRHFIELFFFFFNINSFEILLKM